MRIPRTRLVLFALVLIFQSDRLADQSARIVIDADVRTFTVLAALGEAGLKYAPSQNHQVRLSALDDFRQISSSLREKLQQFYLTHKEGKKDEEQIAKYISLALVSEGPPDFKLTLPPEKIPPDALSVYEFLELVKVFFSEAKIETIWSKYRRFYDDAIISYQPLINRIILTTDGYLRIPSGSYLDRRLVIIPELLAPSNTFNARTYGENYFLVFGPSERLKTDEIRHQYLHFILDPFALRFTLPREVRLSIAKLVESAPNIDVQFRNDLQFLVAESLIRAIELRMNKTSESQASVELDGHIRTGALLARHFYEALPLFEASEEGIRVYYPSLIKTIQFEKVQAAFVAAQNAPVEKPREPTEIERLIEEAHSNLGNNNLEKSKELFEKVLSGRDSTSGEALYGLGIIASIQNNRESARGYFRRALQAPSADKSVVVWSHIYLGRLYDVEGKREEAISEYQAAVDLGDNTRNAQEVAQRGLREPFSPRRRLPAP